MAPSRSLRLPGDAENDGSSQDAPTHVAIDFFAALAYRDWDAAVRLVEPQSLAEFRESQLALIVDWVDQSDSTGSSRAEQLEHHGDVVLRAFPDAPTLRELAALPAERFAARCLAAARGAPSAYRVFGHVLESDDIAHVVYRPIHESPPVDRTDVVVLHLRRHDGRWCVLLSNQVVDTGFILFHLEEWDEMDEDHVGHEPA